MRLWNLVDSGGHRSGSGSCPEMARSTPVIRPSPSSSACGLSFEGDPLLRDAEAMARRAPWMVSVQANNTHLCAGTLIASRWVLVVAHCVAQ